MEENKRSQESDDLEIPEVYVCPITLKAMKDPVSTVDGQTYERSAIEEWFSQGKMISPKTGLELSSLEIKPNYALRESIEEFISLQTKFTEQEHKLSSVYRAAEEESKPTTAAELVAELGINTDSQVKKQAFQRAVLEFLQAMKTELTKHPITWDPQAANTFVGTVIGSLRKNQFNALLMDLEAQGIPNLLKPFISQYVPSHAELAYAKNYPMLAKQLARQLFTTATPDLVLGVQNEGDVLESKRSQDQEPPIQPNNNSGTTCLIL